MKRLGIGTALALLSVAAPAAAAPTVLGRDFLVDDATAPDRPPVSTTRVPYQPGRACYAWTIRVRPEQRLVAIREEFVLPAPAREWNSDADGTFTVAPDRRSAVSTLAEGLDDGLLTNGWCVADGDPLGAYRIRVYDGETLLGQFDFAVTLGEDGV